MRWQPHRKRILFCAMTQSFAFGAVMGNSDLIVRISHTNLPDLEPALVVAASVGAALDYYAPDPGDGASFIVEAIGRTYERPYER